MEEAKIMKSVILNNDLISRYYYLYESDDIDGLSRKIRRIICLWLIVLKMDQFI